MMRSKYYIGHDGRIHQRRRSPEERAERWRFAGTFVGMSLIWCAAMAIASGIFA